MSSFNWPSRSTGVGTYLPLSGGTLSGPLTVNGQLIGKGTTSGDNAAAGYIGEYIEAVVSSGTAWPGTTTQYCDLASIALGAGDWDVTGIADINTNGASVTYMDLGISKTSGNSSTGLSFGQNYLELSASNGFNHGGLSIPNYRINVTGPTTVYLKGNAGFSGGTPQYGCRISARRPR